MRTAKPCDDIYTDEEQQALQSTLTKEMEGKMKLTLTEGVS